MSNQIATFIYISLAALTTIFSVNQRGITVTKKQYGAKWPFTMSSVNVFCDGYNSVYIDAADKTYALNGKAMGKVTAGNSDVTTHLYKEIWLNDPQMKGVKIPVPSEIIKLGLDQCR